MLFVARACRRLGLLPHLNLTLATKINGRSFRVPLRGNLGFVNLTISEPWMTALLLKLESFIRQPDALFVDVGVNIGQTLLKMRSVLPDLPYVGFEPNPSCVSYVAELIAANSFENATVFPFGLFGRPAVLTLQLYSEDRHDSSASLIPDFRGGSANLMQKLNVPVFPISSVVLDRSATFVKIDVEGAELDVVEAIEPVLLRDQPLILMEILPVYHAANHSRLDRQRRLEQFFSALDYQCCRVRKTAADEFDFLEPLASIGIHSDLKLVDYLWIPPRLRNKLDAVVRR
jgi:FkbM family methyltransferase